MLFLTLTVQAKHESLPYDRVLREIGLDIKNSSNCKPLSYSRERERPFTHFLLYLFLPLSTGHEYLRRRTPSSGQHQDDFTSSLRYLKSSLPVMLNGE